MLWLVLALPALWIGLRWSITPDQYGYGHAIGDSGDWAAWLLMATLAVTPLRLVFRRSGWTLWLMRRAALVDTVTLVNLVSETRVVPEFIGRHCRAERIAPALAAVLTDPSAQQAAMALTMERLGRGGEPPGLRAARSVLGALRR